MPSKDAILLVAHGTVASNSELPGFVKKIRRGRPPPPGLIEELEHRYDAIGGSPLTRITEGQATALSKQLGLPCYIAMRLWHPLVEEVLPKLSADGVTRAIVLPLAPFSVQVYVDAAKRAAESVGSTLSLVGVEPWGHSQAFIRAYTEHIRRYLGSESAQHVILTAHSLPSRVVAMGDKYPEEVQRCATAVGAELGVPSVLAYQSQGADGGDWLGPDLQSTLQSLKAKGAEQVVIAPIGFLADHVETLYDLDIEARGWCDELGLQLTRVPALNTEPAFIGALAEVATRSLS